MFKVSEIIDRIKEVKGISTDSALAEILGVTRAAVLNWKNRNSIDIISIANKFNDLDLNYIVYGITERKHSVDNSKNSNTASAINRYEEKLKMKDEKIDMYKEQLRETKQLLGDSRELTQSYKSQFLFQQERIKQLEERLESMQFSNTETVNDALDKERSGHGSNRTLTIEKIKNMDTPAMV